MEASFVGGIHFRGNVKVQESMYETVGAEWELVAMVLIAASAESGSLQVSFLPCSPGYPVGRNIQSAVSDPKTRACAPIFLQNPRINASVRVSARLQIREVRTWLAFAITVSRKFLMLVSYLRDTNSA